MASVISDRQARAVQPGFGMKTPVMAASTGNVTLTSATTGMDGVTPSSGDRLLVWQQTNNWENGIYDYGGSTWNRSLDFDGNSDVRFGTLLPVAGGNTYAGKIAKVNSTGSGSNGVHNFAGSSTSDAFTFSMQDFVQSTAAVPYGSGGTGSTGFNAFGVVIAGSTAFSSLVGSSGRVFIGNGSTLNPSFTSTPILGSSGVEQGTLTLQSSGAGKTIIRASTVAVDYTMAWPSSLGSTGQAIRISGTDGKLEFFTPASGVGSITSGTSGYVAVYSTGTTIQGSSALIITGTTNVAVNSLLDLSSTLAGQIKFPATQNASTDANTFDDYEEGTFTPTGDVSLTVTGTPLYTKIGRTVHVDKVDVTWPVTVDAGAANVYGLPFACAAGFGSGVIGFMNYGTATTLSANGGAVYVYLVSLAGVTLTNANVSTKRFIFSYAYHV